MGPYAVMGIPENNRDADAFRDARRLGQSGVKCKVIGGQMDPDRFQIASPKRFIFVTERFDPP
jgi:hypothetical protein